MNKYSRVFHHITIEDVKRTTRDSSLVERLEEFKEEELVEPVKFVDWRKDMLESMAMKTSGFMIDNLDPANNDISDTMAVDNVDVAGGGWDGSASRASGTGSGWDGGIDWEGKNYAAWSGLSGHSNRSIIYNGIDLQMTSTITIQAIQGDYNNGAKAAGSSGIGVFLGDADGNWVDVGYIINPSEGNYIQWHTGNEDDPQGWRADTFDGMTAAQETEIRNDYSTYLSQSGATANNTWFTMYGKIYSYKGLTTGSAPKSFSVDIPDAYRQKNVVIQLYQNATGAQDPWQSTLATNPYAITRIITKRTAPMQVVVSLDSPDASAFIRDGTNTEVVSREKRRQEVEMRLKAAKSYVEKAFGRGFPASNTVSPGLGLDAPKASPQNAKDQYAAWADELKDEHGHPLFPGGYQNFWDRHADRDGNIPYPSSAYEKIKTLQYMRPPFWTGKTHGDATQDYINSINMQNALGQARARREAQMKRELRAWMNQKKAADQARLQQSSTGNITPPRATGLSPAEWAKTPEGKAFARNMTSSPQAFNNYMKSKAPSTTPSSVSSSVSSYNDPSPQANPWSLGNIAQGQTGYSRDSDYGLQPDGTLGTDKPLPDVGDEQDILDLLGAPNYPQAKQSGKQYPFFPRGDTKVAGLDPVSGMTLVDIIRGGAKGPARDNAIKQLQKHAPGALDKLHKKGFVKGGSKNQWATAARGGEMGQVAGVGDALKGLFGLGPEADKKAKERSKRAVDRLRGKKKIGSGGYDFDSILNQGDNVKGTSLMEKKKKLKSPKQFFNPADIKPEYPEQEPPEQVMGYHPDLIDGEKVSQRFNRLDPISAKSMPLTGNPHIDAKVIKARKKPK